MSRIPHLDLLQRPGVQVDRANKADVYSEVAVDPAAVDTHEHSEGGGGPSRS